MKFLLNLLIFVLVQSNAFGFTIIIDPGHGGDEDGAVAMTQEKTPVKVKEKDITLIYAKMIYEKLQARGHSVFLTRSFDRTVTLPERAAIAEKTKADLFISVHINSSPESGAVGFETYYLDNHDNVAIKKVEKTENTSSAGDLTVQQILVDLVIDQTVSTSKPLATSIHSEIKNAVNRKYGLPSRGIKPGLFYVLALSKRPGVLLEVGFISTTKDRIRMMNPKFQAEYTSAVVRGIEKFLASRKKSKK